MGWFGKIVGGTIGMAIGGPVGAVAGSAIGHGLVDKNDLDIDDGEFSFTLTSDNKDQYFYFLFSLLASVSRIEKEVTRRKLKFLEYLIEETFRLTRGKRNELVRVFNKGLKKSNDISEFNKNFHEFSLFEDISLFTVKTIINYSCSNGNIDQKVREYILKISDKLDIRTTRTESFISRSLSQNRSHFSVIDCFEDDSMQTITKKHRELVSKYHPDKNRETLDRFLEVQNAYEEIKKIKE